MSIAGKTGEPARLRRQAEAILDARPTDKSALGREVDAQRLIHELQVYQLELELQNAELVQARDEIERGLQRYIELYDLAPIAYLTLDVGGRLVQLNLAAAALLGAERGRLVGRDFTPFVAPADRPRFSEFAAGARAGLVRQTCELAVLPQQGSAARCQVRIEAIATESGGVLRAAVLDITEQTRQRESVWRQANYDPLTQLPNRSLFVDRLRHELEMTRRAGQILALLFIDLDRFKEVNDAFGHEAGDQLLEEAARRMSQCVRATDTVARRGGDEFFIVLSALSDTDRVATVARDIVEALAAPFMIGDAVLTVSASVGITLYPLDAKDLSELLRNADQAMYLAKSGGRNRCSYFTPSLQVASQTRQDLIRDLRVALPGGQFEVYFQPIVELATGMIVKAEALLRWHHPQRGMVDAGEFICATDDVGLSSALGDWVFAEAAQWARRWSDKANHAIQVSVNVSPFQFARPGNAARWARMLEDLALDSSRIAIDVTEELLLNDAPVVAHELSLMREAGIMVALANFGTGRSALSSLTHFEIGVLKLSRSLVGQLLTDHGAATTGEAIIMMARRLGIQVVGEGIETAAQRDLLLAAGCEFGQGFLFAPALAPETFWERGSQLPA